MVVVVERGMRWPAVVSAQILQGGVWCDCVIRALERACNFRLYISDDCTEFKSVERSLRACEDHVPAHPRGNSTSALRILSRKAQHRGAAMRLLSIKSTPAEFCCRRVEPMSLEF